MFLPFPQLCIFPEMYRGRCLVCTPPEAHGSRHITCSHGSVPKFLFEFDASKIPNNLRHYTVRRPLWTCLSLAHGKKQRLCSSRDAVKTDPTSPTVNREYVLRKIKEFVRQYIIGARCTQICMYVCASVCVYAPYIQVLHTVGTYTYSRRYIKRTNTHISKSIRPPIRLSSIQGALH